MKAKKLKQIALEAWRKKYNKDNNQDSLMAKLKYLANENRKFQLEETLKSLEEYASKGTFEAYINSGSNVFNFNFLIEDLKKIGYTIQYSQFTDPKYVQVIVSWRGIL